LPFFSIFFFHSNSHRYEGLLIGKRRKRGRVLPFFFDIFLLYIFFLRINIMSACLLKFNTIRNQQN
jgi:hypothetical protein